ncbi:hypothetical protein [Corallococcus exiguus]|uniref:hypothetical protein n=1 Tax=Corallococcus exiguus TaxID=83462 RepID=UPI00147207A8|nr:hypothetical protein [Corallococcus exiguus]NNB88490.1 hypothetical protein [Corallococcus exiguus]
MPRAKTTCPWADSRRRGGSGPAEAPSLERIGVSASASDVASLDRVSLGRLAATWR